MTDLTGFGMRVRSLVLITGLLAATGAPAQQPLPGQPMQAQPVIEHRCELSADRRFVAVSVSNPSPKDAECTVSCFLPYKGGTATITCTKILAGSANNISLCVHGREKNEQFTKLDRSEARCALSEVPAASVGVEKGVMFRYRDWETMTQEEKQFDHLRRR